MPNLTLSIDDAVLAQARRYAANRDTTLNALVREYLANLTNIDIRRRVAVERMIAMADSSTTEVTPLDRANYYADEGPAPALAAA